MKKHNTFRIKLGILIFIIIGFIVSIVVSFASKTHNQVISAAYMSSYEASSSTAGSVTSVTCSGYNTATYYKSLTMTVHINGTSIIQSPYAPKKLKYEWTTSTSTPSSYSYEASYSSNSTSKISYSTSSSGATTGKNYLHIKYTAYDGSYTYEGYFGPILFDKTKPTAGTLTMKNGGASGTTYTPGTWAEDSVYITLANGSDSHSGHKSTVYSIDGGAAKTTSTTITSGGHSIVVTTTDNAGNTATRTYSVKIDSANPTISISNPSGGSWTKNSVTVTATASDAESGIKKLQYKIGSSGSWTDWSTSTSASKTFSDLYYGTFYVKAIDNKGNEATASTRLQIENKAPTITSVTANTTAWTNQNVTLTINGAKDKITIGGTEYNGSGLASKPYSFDGGTTWQAGNTKTYDKNTSGIVIKVRDALGNTYTHSTMNISNIDKTAPTKPTVTQTRTEKCATIITAQTTDTQTGIGKIQYSHDNSNWYADWGEDEYFTDGTASGIWKCVKADMTVYIRAIDGVGNVSGIATTVLKKLTGWQQANEDWYYFNESGEMQTGWQQINYYDKDEWFYFDSEGEMQTGWLNLIENSENHWYYLNESGVMQTGLQKLIYEGKEDWYYFNKSGIMQTGWQKLEEDWYYFNQSGIMQTGEQVIDGNTYNLEEGPLVDGEKYYLNEEGILIKDITAPAKPAITNSSNEEWTKEDVTITVTTKDIGTGIASIEYSYDKETWANNWETDEDFTDGTAEGIWLSQHNCISPVYIRAIDYAGNTSEVVSTIIQIDSIAPTITEIQGNPTEWVNKGVTLTIEGAEDVSSGLAEMPYSFDGGETWQAENTKTYENNTEGIVIKVRDILGNIYTHDAINITKIRRIEKIEVTTLPAKTEYKSYENFETTEMVITATYDNGNQEETKDYIVVNGDNLTCLVKEVEIQYNKNTEIKTEIPITVSHAEVIDSKVEPTCTQTGLTEGKHCDVCNEVLVKQEELLELGHNHEEQVTAPTCTEKGYTTHQCTRCEDNYVDTYTEELGHNFTNYLSNNDATCTQEGTETSQCERCTEKHTKTDKESALGHNYDAKVTSPTCTEKGYTTHQCIRCEDTYVDTYTDVLGHSFTNYVSNNDATCIQDGTETAKCERCTETHTRTDAESALGHNHEEQVTVSTCTEKGYTTHTCTRCNDTYVDTYTDTLGHSFTNYLSNNDATCTKDGTETSQCERCTEKHTKIDIESALGHNHEAQVTVPTCTEKGYTTHQCTRCEDTYVDTYTDALGHSFTNYVLNNDATCTKDGTETAKCDRCDLTDTKEIEESKIPHNYEDGTCTGCGEKEPTLEITTETYNVQDTYITKIQVSTTVKDLKENMQTNATEVNVYNKDKELQEETSALGTGMTVEFKFNNKIYTYTIVVSGDTDGDGEVKFRDMSKVNKHRLNKTKLEGAYLLAADVTGDGEVNFRDLVRINKFRLKKITEL